nr:MAG TPA: hypothetical protein [Caudoviricetes sp.]
MIYISYCLFVYNISNLLKINHLSRNMSRFSNVYFIYLKIISEP